MRPGGKFRSQVAHTLGRSKVRIIAYTLSGALYIIFLIAEGHFLVLQIKLPVDPGVVLLDIGFTGTDKNHGMLESPEQNYCYLVVPQKEETILHDACLRLWPGSNLHCQQIKATYCQLIVKCKMCPHDVWDEATSPVLKRCCTRV